ncbi:MAG: molybdopterin-dependent oxidoreductase [Pseudomonadota bacterium]
MIRRSPIAHHWGSGMAVVDDDRLVSVEPHPLDTDPSRINENIATGVYHASRVLRPAVRKSYLEGGPGPTQNQRGREPFIEVDWDTALDLLANELKRIKSSHGNEAIFAGSYGWASAGRFHHAQSQLKRFLNCFGGFVRSEGNYSYQAALELMPHIVGNFRQHVKEATRWSTVASDGRLVVMFGGIPLRNVQVSGGGVARHRLRDNLNACAQAGVEFINISPLRSDALESVNATWMPPRPGSDTAIMMAIAHTLVAEDLHDQSFLDRYTVGFSRVNAYLCGEADGVVKDAEWAAALSGVDAEQLRALARKMASRRTLICTAVSLQRAEFGEQPLWMTVTLAAMLGQIGLPGGGYGIGYGADASIGTVDRPLHWAFFPQEENPVKNYIPVACVADMLLNPLAEYSYNGQKVRYPDARLVWWAGGNPFHHHQDLNRLSRAFQSPDTVVVNEIAWTATARHADIVLPVASAMERTDFGAGTQDNALVPMPQSIDPVGDSKIEYEIYCDLERRLLPDKSFSLDRTAEQWIESMWQEMQNKAIDQGESLPEFNEFISGNIIEFPDPEPDAVFLSAFRKDPQNSPLPTPSGLIELFSETIDGFSYPDCPGQASWLPPHEWLGSPLAERYPLHLISGQPETRLHSQYDSGDFSMSRKVEGREPVTMHPDDARARGISDGDVVMLFNDRGRCLAGARVTNAICTGVIFLWTGAWFDPDWSRTDCLDRHGNPNVLTHDNRTSQLSQGPAAQSALVEVVKFEGTPDTVTAFNPPLA